MYFVIEKDEGHELKKACDYLNWYRQEKVASYYTPDNGVPRWKDGNGCIPVGSVDFVHKYLMTYYGLEPKPLNVPECLMWPDFTCRKIFNGTYMDAKKGYFAKSNNKVGIKPFFWRLDIVSYIQSKNQIGDLDCHPKKKSHFDDYVSNLFTDKWQFSEPVDFKAEWRCFVFKNELVGLQPYAGEIGVFPCMETIHKMISIFEDESPIAYTLDVGIIGNKTAIIEVHNFYSVGLYGFTRHDILPYMYSGWFKEYLRKEGK